MRCSTPLGERIGLDCRHRLAGTDEEAVMPLAAAKSSVRDTCKRLRLRNPVKPANDELGMVLEPDSLSELSSSSDGRILWRNMRTP